MMRIFDWLFVNHLFRKAETGETIFYPNGRVGRGYVVPSEREADLRSSVRQLTFFVLVGTFGLIWAVRAVESWLGATIPLPWFIAGAVVVVVVFFFVINQVFKRLTAGMAAVGR